jgi:hypothetical protein
MTKARFMEVMRQRPISLEFRRDGQSCDGPEEFFLEGDDGVEDAMEQEPFEFSDDLWLTPPKGECCQGDDGYAEHFIGDEDTPHEAADAFGLDDSQWKMDMKL